MDDPALYQRLGSVLKEAGSPDGVLYYLAIPPSVYGTVAEHLGNGGLVSEEHGWRRVIVEKPFGTDLASARRSSTTCCTSI